MSTGKQTAKRTFAHLPLVVLALTVSLCGAMADGKTRAQDHNEPPHGVRRVLETLETGKRAKYRCAYLHGDISMPSYPQLKA